MSISQAFVDYMNGKIPKGEYLAVYPRHIRHLVTVPARRAVKLRHLKVLDLPTNPAPRGQMMVPDE